MSEFSGLWKHRNNQHALVPLKTEYVAAQVVEELKMVAYAAPPMEERRSRRIIYTVFWVVHLGQLKCRL